MRALSRVLSVLLVLGVLVAFALFVRPFLRARLQKIEEYIPQILAVELTQFLGRDVHVREIHWQGIYRKRHEIEFDGLSLARKPTEVGPSLATVDRLVVHYNPALLSLHFFRPLDAIDALDVYHPVVFVLHDRLGRWNVQNIIKPAPKTKAPRLPLTTTIHVHDGDVSYLDLKPPRGPASPFSARVIHLSGDGLLQQDGPVRFQGTAVGAPAEDGAVPVLGPVAASGVVNVGGGGMDLQIRASRLRMTPVLKSYIALKFASIQTGLADGTVTLQRADAGRFGKAPFEYSINGRFSGLSGIVSKLPDRVTGASGAFALANQAVIFSIDRASYGPAVLSGQGEVLGFHQPFIDAGFNVSGLNDRLLAPLVSPKILNEVQARGPFAVHLDVRGRVDSPDVRGVLNVPSASFRGTQLLTSQVHFDYSNRHMDLTGATFHLGGGEAAVSGVVAVGRSAPGYRLTGYLRNVNIAALPLPPAVRASRPTGRVTANLVITGVGATAGVTGAFSIDGPALALKNNSFTGDRVTGIADLAYQPAGSSDIGLRLSMDGLRLTSRGNIFSAAHASTILNARFAGGKLSGITTQGLMTDLRGHHLNLESASWLIKPGQGSVDEANILVRDPRGEIRASGSVAQDLSAFHLNVVARNVDLEHLSAAAPRSAPLQGIAFIRGDLVGTPANPRFSGSFQILGPSYGSLAFERIHGSLRATPDGVALSDLTLHWGPGEVVLNGSVGLRSYMPETLHLRATATGISLSRLAELTHQQMDVSGSASADLSIAGTVTHPLIAGGITLHDATVQQYALTTATSTFSYAPDLAAFRSSPHVEDFVRGLTLRSLAIDSPLADVRATGSAVGPGGKIAIHADISRISLAMLHLPRQITTAQEPAVSAEIRGTLEHPEIIMSAGRESATGAPGESLRPLQLDIDGQSYDLRAEDITVRPDLAGLDRRRARTGTAAVDYLSIGSLSLQRPGVAIRVSGQVIPRLQAVATASGFELSTLAGMFRRPLPAGLSGSLQMARLELSGALPAFSSNLTDQLARPGFLTRALGGVSGSLAVTLTNLEMVPPAPAVPAGPVAPNTAPAAAATPRPIPPAAGAGTTLAAAQPATVSAATTSDTAANAPVSTTPDQAPVRFAIAQLNASFNGPRVTIDDLHVYQYAPPDPRAPGLNLEVLSPPGGPAPYFELGGDIAITAEAPLIPVSLFSPWLALTRNMTGDLQLAVRASGRTYSPRVQISVDEAVAPVPAEPAPDLTPSPRLSRRKRVTRAPSAQTPKSGGPAPGPPSGSAPGPGSAAPTPLVIGGVELQRASVVASVQEGAIQLNELILAARGHALEAIGSLPFTWHPSPGKPLIPEDRPISLDVGLQPDTLAAFHDLAPDVITAASGSLSAGFTVGGTLKSYTIHGSITAGSPGSPGKLALNHVDQPIQNLLIDIGFDGRRVTINRFSGGADKGTFQITGYAELPTPAHPGGDIQMALKTVGLHLTDRGLIADTILRPQIASPTQRKASYEEVIGFLESQITLAGELARPLISGSVSLHDTSVRATLLPGRQTPPPSERSFNPSFNLTFTLGKNVSVALANVVRVKPTGSLTLTDNLEHPVLNGRIDTGRGGGYVNYYVGFWRIDNSSTYIHYEPPADPTASSIDIYLHAVLTTTISDSTTNNAAVQFFGPSGQSLQVTMEVDGRPFVPDGFHILSLTSDPPRPRADLERLILHEQTLQNLLAGNSQSVIPGLFNEVVRQSLMGNILAPWEMQLASSLGLEEVNVSYDFGGPVFVEVSRHLFSGISARLREAVTAGNPEYQFYFDYHLRGSLTLSFGLLQRPNYQDESLTLQSFMRF